MRSWGRNPYRSVAMSWMAVAARTFQSAVRAWPSVSMHVHTTAAPNSLARVRNESSRVPGSSPSSRLTELMTARPPIHDRAVSIDGRLGGVDHQRGGGLGGEAGGHLLHVGHPVGAGVVDADVDEVGALLDLVAGHGHAGVPVGFEHGLAELLRAVGVGALTHDEERGVLGEGNLGVDGGGAVLGIRPPDRRGEIGAGLDHRGQMGRCGPAAPADHRHPQLAHELAVVLGQLLRGQVVVHGPVDHRGEPGIGQAADREWRRGR